MQIMFCNPSTCTEYFSTQIAKLKDNLVSKEDSSNGHCNDAWTSLPFFVSSNLWSWTTHCVNQSQKEIVHKMGINFHPWATTPWSLSPRPIQKTSYPWWLSNLLQQLWNTAWDLWQYHNGVVHNQQDNAQYEKLQNDTQLE